MTSPKHTRSASYVQEESTLAGPGYAVIPGEIFTDKQLSKTDLRTLGAIASLTARTARAWPTAKDLAAFLDAPRIAVVEAAARLALRGYVRAVRFKDDPTVTRYAILLNKPRPSEGERS